MKVSRDVTETQLLWSSTEKGVQVLERGDTTANSTPKLPTVPERVFRGEETGGRTPDLASELPQDEKAEWG